MKLFRLILLCSLIVKQGFGQERNVKTKIAAANIFELSIIQVYPDSFPTVSVVFQAKNEFGKPLWLLKKNELNISENGVDCQVIRLKNITKDKPLNIGIVLDHSGSMLYNPEVDKAIMEKVSDAYFGENSTLPKGFTSSLDCAKNGILEFIKTSLSDSIFLVSFSEEIDYVLPLTLDASIIESFLKPIQPDGGTAFYDGINRALDSLIAHSSASAIIAMTDGLDNSSKHSLEEIIKKAVEHNIPIYVIGLGEIDASSLKKLTKATNGFLYQTNEPSKLTEIYASIKEQLKSIYQVDYTSLNTDFDTDERGIMFSFENDTLTFADHTERYKLPEEALIYLKEQDEIRLQVIQQAEEEELRFYWILGGAVGLSLIGFASYIVFKRRKRNQLVVSAIFPNPFDSDLHINYILPADVQQPQLEIYDLQGQEKKLYPLNPASSEININTLDFYRGVYIIKVVDGTNSSNAMKVVKK